MITITLPKHLHDAHLVAGVEFTGGTAVVDRLGRNVRHYFRLIGATVTETEAAEPAETVSTSAQDADTVAALHAGGKLLSDCSVPELRTIAKTEGIELPARATKPEILSAFLTAFHEED